MQSKWAIAVAVSLAALLEIIDTSIVNVALADMQATLGTTLTEIGWVVTSYSVANVIIGARNEEQLRQNLGAVGWELTPAQVAKLDAASAVTPAYPYWHQRGFAERNPPPV